LEHVKPQLIHNRNIQVSYDCAFGANVTAFLLSSLKMIGAMPDRAKTKTKDEDSRESE
jgi:hypothetical protein